MSSSTPPGWYPDPSGQHQTRWWDGFGWTQQVGPPTSQMPRPRVADSVRTDTVFVWVMALLPLVSLPLLALYHPQFRYEVVGPGHLRTVDPRSVYTGAYFLVQGIGLLLYGVGVLLAYLDHRELRRRGVVRPFAWPWAFLGAIVYLIGRYVVVRKVAPGRPMRPLWTYIALLAVTFVVSIASAVVQFRQMLP